jgi:hypothetical protein
LGGVVVSMRPEAQYLEFSMSASLCNVEFNSYSIALPNFGAILAWWIHLASLEI